MEIVSAIIGNIAGLIFVPVTQEIRYPFSYKSNVDKLKVEIQKLTGDWTDKQRIVEDEKRNNRDIAAAVQDWLNRVEDAIADSNKFINEDNEGHGEVRCLKRPFPNLCVRRRLGKDAENMAQKVSALIDEGRSHQILSFPVPSQTTTSPFARGYEALESRTSILNEIKQALNKDPNIYMIGVYGMGGVGKTTLVKELAFQVEREGSFGVVVMATPITNTPDLRRIQDELADGLRLKLETKTEEGRAGELRGRISREKSILVILDDIWGELNLAELGVPYGDDHKGCKLVLTSRDHNVLSRKMNTQKDFSLQVFSEGDGWSLFEKITGDVVKLQSIKSIAIDVVKCCAGLPLLIDIVGKCLRKEQDVLVWNDTLTRLKSSSGDYKDKVNNTLKLSYERLEREELKSLFLLVGSFGQVGISVHTEELLQVCWCLDIYKDVRTLSQARNRQHTLIEDLRASSLLLDGETKWVRMHDFVYDVAKLIASETRFIYTGERLTKINEWPKNNQLQSYHHIILRDYHISELLEKLECIKFEVLLLGFIGEGYLKIPDNFFSEMGEELKVLYLRRMKLTKPPPSSLCRLACLRSLNLFGSELEDIAIIGELTSLEILILEGAKKIVELPKEIGNLTRLWVLNVRECQELRLIPKNLLTSLDCLEELYMEGCPIEWEVEGSNNHNNIASLGDLRNLDKLTTSSLAIEDGSILPGDLRNFANLERLLRLGGSSAEILLSNAGIKALLTRVEDMCSMDSGYVNGDGCMELRHLVLAQLRSLLIVDMGLTPLTLFAEKDEMPNLETMKLNGINTCKIWNDNLVAHSCFPNLMTLEISDCGRLKSLFPSSVARALVKLKHLHINRCRKLNMIFDQEDISREEVILPNLETVLISNLDELESLWPSHLVRIHIVN